MVKFNLELKGMKMGNGIIIGYDRESKKCKKCKTIFFICLFIILFLITIFKFHNTYITVFPDEGNVYVVDSYWWGFKKKYHRIVWMKTPDYETPGWMTWDKKHGWYKYILEPDFYPD